MASKQLPGVVIDGVDSPGDSTPSASKGPGVYIVDKDAFPSSVVQVATAVPAFVGFTWKAADDVGKSLLLKPFQISSIQEFYRYFGGGDEAAIPRFSLFPAETQLADGLPLALRDADPIILGGTRHLLRQTSGWYLLAPCMGHFFANGGSTCYIVSAGICTSTSGMHVDRDSLINAISALEREQEPTFLVVPEAVLLEPKDCAYVQRAALKHCAGAGNRIALLDVPDGYHERGSAMDAVGAFRAGIGREALAFGAAWFPWVNCTLGSDAQMGWDNVDEQSRKELARCIMDELKAMIPREAEAASKALRGLLEGNPRATIDRGVEVVKLARDNKLAELDKGLRNVSRAYSSLLTEMRRRLNVLPMSPAMAAIYTTNDAQIGAWKAPENVGLIDVSSPAAQVSDRDILELGKGNSLNFIRAVEHQGVLASDVCLLDGSLVSEHRTISMIRESIRWAVMALKFEPNTESTWVTVKSMVSNFLVGLWKQGALVGAVPEEAFDVRIGAGKPGEGQAEDVMEVVVKVVTMVRGLNAEILLSQVMLKE